MVLFCFFRVDLDWIKEQGSSEWEIGEIGFKEPLASEGNRRDDARSKLGVCV